MSAFTFFRFPFVVGICVVFPGGWIENIKRSANDPIEKMGNGRFDARTRLTNK